MKGKKKSFAEKIKKEGWMKMIVIRLLCGLAVQL